jgi:hypothetical protein
MPYMPSAEAFTQVIRSRIRRALQAMSMMQLSEGGGEQYSTKVMCLACVNRTFTPRVMHLKCTVWQGQGSNHNLLEVRVQGVTCPKPCRCLLIVQCAQRGLAGVTTLLVPVRHFRMQATMPAGQWWPSAAVVPLRHAGWHPAMLSEDAP